MWCCVYVVGKIVSYDGVLCKALLCNVVWCDVVLRAVVLCDDCFVVE